ncbi:hypothetical protein [Clostridium sp.]|jgi:hypothetical protein|uniref:hypothetical protein n=1 Tax=Clostridium sp. TaxID=1506 RepID=UPI003EEFE07B
MEKQKKVKDEVAFKNFRGSVTKNEFELVLKRAEDDYLKLKRLSDKSVEFKNKSEASLAEVVGGEDSASARGTARVVKGLIRQANKEVIKLFGDEIDTNVTLTDFINKFKVPGEELPYLDFTFLNQ